MSKRILLKISGESLMGPSNYGIDVSTINKISNEIKNVYKKKYQICLIIGGGNIFRGIKGASEGIDRSTSDYMGIIMGTFVSTASTALYSILVLVLILGILRLPSENASATAAPPPLPRPTAGTAASEVAS